MTLNAQLEIPGGIPAMGPTIALPATVDAYSLSMIRFNATTRGKLLTHWFQAGAAWSYLDGSGRMIWRDRISDARARTSGAALINTNAVYTEAGAINALPCLTGAGATGWEFDEDQHINAAEFTIASVVMNTSNENNYIIGQGDVVAGAGDWAPAVALSGGGAGTNGTPVFYDTADALTPLQAINAVAPNTAALLVFGSSDDVGRTIRVNGVQKSNIASTTHLTHTRFRLWQNRGITTSTLKGHNCVNFVWNIDLCHPNNQDILAEFEDLVMARHGL